MANGREIHWALWSGFGARKSHFVGAGAGDGVGEGMGKRVGEGKGEGEGEAGLERPKRSSHCFYFTCRL